MNRTEVIKRPRRAAKDAGVVGGYRSTLGRHAEIDDVTARKFFDQYAEILGKGWWR